MKKMYAAPDFEVYAVRPDEQIAANCQFLNAWSECTQSNPEYDPDKFGQIFTHS